MGWIETLSAWWDDIRSKRRSSVAHSEDAIDKSPEDKRSYRGLLLKNGLKVLIVSDPTTDKAAASLDVNVGHTSDPVGLPGLAHLCEHMLFMGTKESREATNYKRYLCEHGGSSNAYTSIEHTNYHFDVGTDYLREALARFSKFIKSPTFSPLFVQREINVVSAEHEKNKFNDQWRLFQLNKSTANPDHPYSKFGTGNTTSLHSGTKDSIYHVYNELVNFHKTFYSANIMCLVVVGKESVDTLEDIVIQLFSCIKSKNVKLSPTELPPYGPSHLKVVVQVVPIKDMQNMLLTWPIQDLIPMYRIKPAHYIGHCIGYQGPGSVFAELKRKGWVNSFAAAQKFGGKGYMFFCISMDLTDAGFNNTDAIILMIFQFINLIKEKGIQEHIYQECSEIKSLRFRYKDKELPRDFASDCSELLHVFPFKDVLTGPWLMWDFQPLVISNVLACLNPDTIRVTIRSRKFVGETNHIEKWYGTEYSIHPIPEVTLQCWRNAGIDESFHLPPRNEFIPKSLSLVDKDPENPEYPTLLEDSKLIKLWVKQDDEFFLPKTYITMQLTSAVAHHNPHNEMKGDLLIDLLTDHLEELSYPAQLAGSIFDVFCTPRGITLAVQGFSDKIEVLLTRLLEKIVHFKLDDTRFDAIKNKYLKMLSNFDREAPFKQAKYLSNCILSTRVWTRARLLEEAQGVTPDQIKLFLEEIFSKVHLEILMYGNITRMQAKSYTQTIKEVFLDKMSSKALENPQIYHPEEIKLVAGHHFYHEHRVHSSFTTTNAAAVHWQCGPESIQHNSLTELFVHLINQHAYDVIRTQQQLGYIVMCEVRGPRGVRGVRLVVQSHIDPNLLVNHILQFMKNTQTYLESMSEETFLNHKNSLKGMKSERPRRMMDQSAHYWREISTNKYQFDRHKVEANFLDVVCREDILDLYERYFQPESKECRVLAIHVMGTSTENDAEREALSSHMMPVVKIEDIECFKSKSDVWCK